MSGVRDAARLAAVAALGLLDTPPEERFDRISRTAAALFGVPVALVTLLDDTRLHVKSCVGVVGGDVPRAHAVCATTVEQDGPLLVPDLVADPRFARIDAVRQAGLRSYAGVPLHVGGFPVGTLCLFDVVVRHYDDTDVARLGDLAAWAEQELQQGDLVRALQREAEVAAQLAAVLDAAPSAVLVLDGQGRVTEANSSTADVFGRSREEVLGRHVATLVQTEDGRPLGDLLERDGLLEVGLQARRSGGPVPVEVRTRRLALPGVARVLDVRDTSGEAEAAAELAVLQQRFELLLAAAATGVVGTDADGCITVVNPAAAEMLGECDGLVGGDLHALLHEDAHDAQDCPVVRALRDREVQHVRADVLHRPDGSSLEVEWSAAPIVVAKAVTGTVVTLRDISERRAVERLKDEFVSVVSHELRTPLTSIRGSLGLLGSGRFGDLPEAAARLVQIAVGNTDRLVRLVNDILDLERIESGKAEVQLLLQPLEPLLRQARDAAVGPGTEVPVVVVPTAVEAPVEADLLVQAVTNLIANAVKFSPAGSPVSIACREVDGEVLVEVTDRGRGIPQDRLVRIFERFEQVDASDARVKGGTGLGLAITRSIATALGGRVLVSSEPDVGSTFTLALPVGLSGDVASGRWVVLVEDDVDLSELLSAALRDQGLDVAVARTEDEAVDLVRRLRPVLLLLDVELARGSGFGVAAALRADEATAGTRTVVATVHDLDEASRRRLTVGTTDFVRKGRGDEDVVQVLLAIADGVTGGSAG